MVAQLRFGASLGMAAFAACALALAAPAIAGPQGEAENEAAEAARQKRYQDCIELARSDPFGAREEAASWEAVGGGAQARHCAAIALIAQGAEREAAQILTEIGSSPETRLNAEDRVAILSLGGELWLQLGRHDLAKATYSQALKLNAAHRRSLIGAAHAEAALGQHDEAEKRLSAVLQQSPQDAEALTFRAAARRLLGRHEPALKDAAQATELRPDSAPAWFERGAAERALGKGDAARESWLKASILDLTGQVGDDARHGLAVLDAGG